MYIPVALAIGALAGLVRGGSLRNLAHATFRWPVFLVAGSLLQIVAVLPALEQSSARLLVASYASLLVFAAANVALAGMAVVGFGIALNALVIGVNGGMPVKAEAIVAAGIAEDVAEAERLEFSGKRHLATDNDRLVVLADVIPVPVGGGSVLSYGDLVIALGTAVVLDALVRKRGVPTISS